MRNKIKHSVPILITATLLSLLSIVFASFTSIKVQLIEDCTNALDDDNDGLIDLNDPDCICEILSPESLIPNPSFEDRTCCPTERSRLNCAEGWIQASEPTTDLINQCGWTGWDGHFPPTPFPDGESIMGFANGRLTGGSEEYNWKEYAGACLTSPLKANTTYRFEFSVGFTSEALSPALDITFFGTTDCENLPFGMGNADLGCPTNGPNWKLLGDRNVGGGGGSAWVKTEITITPEEDIHAIAIGPPCARSSANRTTYYFFDNLVLADLRSFEFQISEINHPCAGNFTLEVPEERGIEYQWYKGGIALVGEESARLSMHYGEGDYQVRIESEGSCLLTQIYTYSIPVISDTTFLTLCFDESYQFGGQVITESGNYIETLITNDNCDSIVALTLSILPILNESVSAKIFEGNTYEEIENNRFNTPGDYEVHLINDIGCDSTIHLQLEYYAVYFPNIFTPNGDGNNDHFLISGDQDLSEIKSIHIYDRWGSLIYKGIDEFKNNSRGWNGRTNGNQVEQGIYTYISTLELNDGSMQQVVGSVLLML